MGLFFTIPVLARNTKRSNQLVFLIACTFFVLLIVRSDLLYNFYSSSRIYVQSMSFFNLWTTFWFGTAVYWVVGLFFVLWNIIRIPPNFKDKSLVTTCIITATFCTWFMWVVIYMSQMYPLPGVSPQVLWPENYNCTHYPPDAGEICYEPNSIF